MLKRDLLPNTPGCTVRLPAALEEGSEMQLICTHCCKFIVSLLSVTVRGSVGEWLRSRWLHLINFAGSFLTQWSSQHWRCYVKTLLRILISAAALKMHVCPCWLVGQSGRQCQLLLGLVIVHFSIPKTVAQVSPSITNISWGSQEETWWIGGNKNILFFKPSACTYFDVP